MKRFVMIWGLVVVALGFNAALSQGLPPPEPIEKIGDNLYKIFGGGGNTTVFVRENGVVLIDTKMPGNGEAILAEVRKVTDKPITLIVNTHAHPDHLGSNAFFVEADPTVDVAMHVNAVPEEGSPFYNVGTVPTITYDSMMTLGKGPDTIVLHNFGPAHTTGDTYVIIPAERALLMGDVMAWEMGPLFDTPSGGTVRGMAESLDKLVAAASAAGVEKVVEGHGKVIDWDGFLGYVAYIHKIVDVAERAVAEGLDYVEAYERYFADDSTMAAYLSDELKKGLEYGSTPKTRTLNNLYVAIKEDNGEPAPLVMGAPPPPGE